MVESSLKNQILLMFRAKDFHGMWFIIKQNYEELGFSDPMTDQQKIDEYKWIVQQLRKYMFSKQDEIMACESIEDMIDFVDMLIGKADEYAEERKKIVYNFIRDGWLYELRNYLSMLLYEAQDGQEAKEDE